MLDAKVPPRKWIAVAPAVMPRKVMESTASMKPAACVEISSPRAEPVTVTLPMETVLLKPTSSSRPRLPESASPYASVRAKAPTSDTNFIFLPQFKNGKGLS